MVVKDKSGCPYMGSCKPSTEQCPLFCDRYTQVMGMVRNCGIPEGHKLLRPPVCAPEDKEAFQELNKIKNTIETFVATGCNLYLYSSNTGNGKTCWGIRLMYKYFDCVWPYQDPCNSNNYVAYFCQVPTLLNAHRNWDKSDAYKNTLKSLANSELVIWDDMGTKDLTSTEQSFLQSLLDNRIIMGRSNIYTGNLDNTELLQAVGSRLHSRIWEGSIRIKLKGHSLRGLDVQNYTNIE